MPKYRVTWLTYKVPMMEQTRQLIAGTPVKDIDYSMIEHERVFTNLDQGWDFCQDLRKGSSRTFNATWEHIHD